MKYIKEACVENFREAMAVQVAGANRIELCENLVGGGTTPSYGTIKKCMENLNIPVFVMIRPRTGDFVYSEDEINIMKEDIQICKQLGVQGVVFGLLTKEGKIDETNTLKLVELARPMRITFHKAFDELNDLNEALETLIRIGVDRILTSGTRETALEGAVVLSPLIESAKNRIIIVAAGRITKDNLPDLSRMISTSEFHGRKIV